MLTDNKLRRVRFVDKIELKEFMENSNFLKQSGRIEQLYAQSDFLIREAMRLKNSDGVENILKRSFKEFTLDLNMCYFQQYMMILEEVEQYFQQVNEEHRLAFIYLMKGHLHFFKLNYDKAESHYQEAISHAIKNEEYTVVSMALLHIAVMHFHDWPEEQLWNVSKMVPVFYKMDSQATQHGLASALLLHLEVACKNGKIEYFQKLYDAICKLELFEPNSQESLHFQCLKVFKWMETAQYAFVMEYGEPLFNQLMHHSYTDLSNRMHEVLSQCYSQLGNDEKKIALEQEFQGFLAKVERFKDILNREYAANEEIVLIGGLPKEEFRKQTDVRLLESNSSISGYTMLVLEFSMKEELYEQNIERIMQFANGEIHCSFYKHDVISTRFSPTTLAFLIEIEEQKVHQRLLRAIQSIQAYFQEDLGSPVEVSYGYANNRHNDYYTYDECLQLAYAYMYYDINRLRGRTNGHV